MIYIPTLKPLIENGNSIYTEITYEKRFTKVDDVTHDEEHIHDFYEIYINLSGDVSFLVEDNIYPISRGDIIVSAPNEIHRCIYHSDCVHEHFCIWIREIPFATAHLKKQFDKNKLLVLPEEEKERVINACFGFYKSRISGGSPFGAVKNFFEILDITSAEKHGTTEAESLPQSFSKIVEYISNHYTEASCTVTLLCDVFYISKSTLCRRFRNHFQTTPSDYIESKRFSEAKKLLSTGQSVQNACFNSGFSDCSYFIMRFRKKFGITPYKYQKEFV
ncbi:MAG: helix-turn-helix domain-containing protein [Clostridia bacterium]|nr:helix-turn-helix domain-containing protein [Clostridia bacterium]